MEAVTSNAVVDTGSKIHADSVDLAAEGSIMEGFGLPMTTKGVEMSLAQKALLLKGCKPSKVDERTGFILSDTWLVEGVINTVYMYESNPRLEAEAPVGSRPVSTDDNFGLSLCLVQNPRTLDYGIVIREKVDELIPINEEHGFTWAKNAEGGLTNTVTVAGPGDRIIVGKSGAKWVPWTSLDEAAWTRRAQMEERAGRPGVWFLPVFEVVGTKRVSTAEQGEQILKQAKRAYEMQRADRNEGRAIIPNFEDAADLIAEIAF